MINIDKLVEMGFTIPQSTNITAFFRNIGYLARFTMSDLVDGYVLPADKVIAISSQSTLDNTFKSDTQFYADIATLLVQKGNMKPNKSGLNNVIVFQMVGTDYGQGVTNFIQTNANWAQLTIDSRIAEDIEGAAASAKLNDRLFVTQTSDTDVTSKITGNIAQSLKALNNDCVLLSYHVTDTENLAGGLASITAQAQLGTVGALYSTVTNVTPQDYTDTINDNLDNQNVTYYSIVNPINGGGVQQYGSPIVYGALMVTGEDAKRRYTRYAIDKLMKAKAIDFLKKKLGYEDISAKVLDAMLTTILVAGQSETGQGRLIKKDTVTPDGVEKKGFELFVTPPSVLQDVEPDLYNSQTYKVTGYYRDSLTGRKVIIDLVVDPNEAELSYLMSNLV